MRLKGLEPPRLASLDPKSSAATNYATAAKSDAKIVYFFISKVIPCFLFINKSFYFELHLILNLYMGVYTYDE